MVKQNSGYRCIVYKYESPRGKTYIGQTKQTLHERIKQHISMAIKTQGTTDICRELRYHKRDLVYNNFDEDHIYDSFKVIRIIYIRNYRDSYQLDSIEDEEIYKDQQQNRDGNLIISLIFKFPYSIRAKSLPVPAGTI